MSHGHCHMFIFCLPFADVDIKDLVQWHWKVVHLKLWLVITHGICQTAMRC